eukprot:CAMPEP_0174940136 /NCGR_PEP_ID=MMETSP1355-20121228/68338_1 /TAXON_ID=464990 /ORGANISM="Hemiselmis tepida, Strain CCMP443" /LENGTH=62 /DNA_ID=CAMNT_0016187183 /DNA_START=202 /DNA_END=387 /DNA_ORIENTATION=+
MAIGDPFDCTLPLPSPNIPSSIVWEPNLGEALFDRRRAPCILWAMGDLIPASFCTDPDPVPN